MKKYLDVKGCSIVNENGNISGIIDDCIVDYKIRRIYSFVVVKKHFLNTYYLLSLKNVTSFGGSVMFRDEIYKLNKYILSKNKSFSLQNLIGREVIDSKGIRVGKLIDVIFDETNGILKALVCSRGVLEDLLEGRKLIIVDEKTVFSGEKIIVDCSGLCMINDASFKKFLK